MARKRQHNTSKAASASLTYDDARLLAEQTVGNWLRYLEAFGLKVEFREIVWREQNRLWEAVRVLGFRYGPLYLLDDRAEGTGRQAEFLYVTHVGDTQPCLCIPTSGYKLGPDDQVKDARLVKVTASAVERVREVLGEWLGKVRDLRRAERTRAAAGLPVTMSEAAGVVNKMLENNPTWSAKRVRNWLRKQRVTIYSREAWRSAFGAYPPATAGQPSFVCDRDLHGAIRAHQEDEKRAAELVDTMAERRERARSGR